MVRPRAELQLALEEVSGLPHDQVYFQAPPNDRMKFPCIRYALDTFDVKYADNQRFSVEKRYTVTVIDRDPDSDIHEKIAELPFCSHNRFYVADNLNHNVYTLYF